jgi:uncharacterized protein (DUF2252 family)
MVRSTGTKKPPTTPKPHAHAPHRSPADRAAAGLDARSATPRSALAHFEPDADRSDPVELLESQGAARVQELIPIRYGRMLDSPFSFYRGAALIMASDLDKTPRVGLQVQLCGDAHLSNFGAYGTAERRLVFDVNDFDETNPGPFEWDLKRMVTSFEIAARQNSFDDKARKKIVLTAARSYRVAMTRLAGQGEMDVWYDAVDVQALAEAIRASKQAGSRKASKALDAAVARAQRHNATQAVHKLTTVVGGKRQIVNRPPLVVPIADLAHQSDVDLDRVAAVVRETFLGYRHSLQTDRRRLLERFTYVDLARKVVGVGSVGTRCWILLLTGRDQDDLQLLQFKEADRSVLEDFTDDSVYSNHAERVVEGQRLMQSSSDIFLGWTKVKDADGVQRNYYFRQLRDWKLSAEVETMPPKLMKMYAKFCGATLAKAHARTGDRIAIAAYAGIDDSPTKPNAFDKALVQFAVTYADQNHKDYKALKRAAKEDRVTAQTGI